MDKKEKLMLLSIRIRIRKKRRSKLSYYILKKFLVVNKIKNKIPDINNTS